MSSEWSIPAGEHGVIRVFALDLDETDADRFARAVSGAADGGPVRDALGAGALDPEFVEVFPVSDLAEMGLAGYLVTGLGAAEDQVTPFQSQLDGIRGHVVIVLSSAFGGEAMALSPRAPLRPVVTVREPLPMPSFTPLTSEGASGQLGPPVAEAPAPAGRSRLPLYAILALILAVIAVLAFILD